MAVSGQFDRHEDHIQAPRARKIAYSFGDVAMRLIIMLVPTAFLLVGALLSMLYPLTEERVHEVRAVLEARRRERRALQDTAGSDALSARGNGVPEG